MTCVTGEREISLYPSWKPMRLPEVEDVTDAPFLVHLCFHSQFPDKPLPMGSNIVPYTGSLQGLPQFGLPRSLPHYPLGFFKNVLLRCSWAVNSVTPRGVWRSRGPDRSPPFLNVRTRSASRIPFGNRQKYRECPYPWGPEITAPSYISHSFRGIGWCSELGMNREFSVSIRQCQFLITEILPESHSRRNRGELLRRRDLSCSAS